MRGRPGAIWQARLGKQLEFGATRAAALDELAQSGFRALWIDWSGYALADRSRLRAEMVYYLGAPFASRPDGTTECYRIGKSTDSERLVRPKRVPFSSVSLALAFP